MPYHGMIEFMRSTPPLKLFKGTHLSEVRRADFRNISFERGEVQTFHHPNLPDYPNWDLDAATNPELSAYLMHYPRPEPPN